jgi:hypothetical protein
LFKYFFEVNHGKQGDTGVEPLVVSIFMDSRGFGEEYKHDEEHNIQRHTSPNEIGLLSMTQTTIPIELRGKDRKVESHMSKKTV